MEIFRDSWVQFDYIITRLFFLSALKLEPSPTQVITDAVCVPQFRYLLGVVLVNKIHSHTGQFISSQDKNFKQSR